MKNISDELQMYYNNSRKYGKIQVFLNISSR